MRSITHHLHGSGILLYSQLRSNCISICVVMRVSEKCYTSFVHAYTSAVQPAKKQLYIDLCGAEDE
jgi:hypothetical protein